MNLDKIILARCRVIYLFVFIDFVVDTAPPLMQLHCALRDEVNGKELTVLSVSGQP